jgi:predicted transcriptional regulator
MSVVESTEMEVLEPGRRALSELAQTANAEHRLAEQAGLSMLEHAITAGEALLEARQAWDGPGWQAWIREELDFAQTTATLYIRFADRGHELRAAGISSINAGRAYLRGLTGPVEGGGGWRAMPEEIKEQARRLVGEGMSNAQVARLLGVSESGVLQWTNPEYAERNRERNRRYKRERNARKKEEREREREREIKRAARKAGGAQAKAYAKSESLQDDLGQAHREAVDREAREAWSRAGVYYRKMRDEIVRALGVS